MLTENSQISFSEVENAALPLDPMMVDTLNAMVDWKPITLQLETMYVKDVGRPAIPPLMMFKILLLESWFDLSDVKAAIDIHDRISFMRFLGGEVRRYKIDSSSIVRFRERLRAATMDEQLKTLVNEQIHAHGYMVRTATVVDATLVKAATTPTSKKRDGTPVDPDVKATQRNGRPIDGMKVHLSMDAETGFIEEVRLTTIEVHDHNVFEELIPAETQAVYADKAYGSKKHRTWLKERKITDCLFFKGRRKHPLTHEEIERNKEWSPTRAGIERKNADLKHRCSLKRLRYIGLRRNWTQVLFAVIACNLKRFALIG